MKLISKFKRPISLVLLYLFPLALWVQDSQAADVTNVAFASSYEDGDFIVFEVTLIHTGAATDDVYSQAIDIHGLELEGATIQAKSLFGTTGRDVNIDIQGSNFLADSTFERYQTRSEFDDFSPDGGGDEETVILDRDFPKANTITNFLNNTNLVGAENFVAVADTSTDTDVVWVEKDQALRCRYIRIISSGQSGNPATSSTRILIRMPKKPGAYQPVPANRLFDTTS